MRYAPAAISLMMIIILFCSCSRDYSIELPEHESMLVVECYLEDGQPLRALVSESTALLDTSLIPPVFINAVVTITHAGRTDTLRPFIYVDSARNRAYNYGSNTIVQADYTSGATYRIEVRDNNGRIVSGETKFIPRVPIKNLTTVFNEDDEASCITTISDAPGTKNYYRLVLNRNSYYDSIQQNTMFADDFVNNVGDIVIRSRYRYRSGDSIHATLYHLSQDFYDYLNTSRSATSALGNPFAASGEIVSNIQGGLGVFTALSYTKASLQVP